MVCIDQPRPFQGIEQVPPFPSQDLEPSFLERFDLRNLDDDGSQLRDSWVTRCSQFPQSGRIFRRDMRLLQVIEDLSSSCSMASLFAFGIRAQSLQTWVRWPLPENFSFGRVRPQILQ